MEPQTLVGVIKATAELCCLVPLYPSLEPVLENQYKIVFSVQPCKPIAYVFEHEEGKGIIIEARRLEKYVEILGEL